MFLRDIRNRPHLLAAQQSIGDANTHHEIRCRLALSTRSADNADTIALRVHAPGAEIHVLPLRGNGIETFARELADLVEMLPGIFFELESLDALCFRFFNFAHV